MKSLPTEIQVNIKCTYDMSWAGDCKNNANESGFCDEHENIKCVSCGEQATRDCHETMGLVCGASLCSNCEHTIQSNGCNSGGKLPEGLKNHCKKSEQVYQPWYFKPE